jgi:hypothetical protein
LVLNSSCTVFRDATVTGKKTPELQYTKTGLAGCYRPELQYWTAAVPRVRVCSNCHPQYSAHYPRATVQRPIPRIWPTGPILGLLQPTPYQTNMLAYSPLRLPRLSLKNNISPHSATPVTTATFTAPPPPGEGRRRPKIP